MGANEKHAATYHGGKYTPTTDELRDIWVDYNLNPLPRSQGIPLVETAQADFDRWLETVRAEAKAEALRDAARNIWGVDGDPDYKTQSGNVRYMLNRLADMYEHCTGSSRLVTSRNHTTPTSK